MFDITITSFKGVTLFNGRTGCDWMRGPMAEALQLVFGPKIEVTHERGNPSSPGLLSIVLCSSEERKAQLLGELLMDADWQHNNMKGYGLFIEQLVGLRYKGRLQGSTSVPIPTINLAE